MCWGPAAVAGLLSSFSAIAGLPGTPEIHHGLYYVDNNGRLIPTTLAGYQRGMRGQQRIFTSVPAVLYAMALWLDRHRA